MPREYVIYGKTIDKVLDALIGKSSFEARNLSSILECVIRNDYDPLCCTACKNFKWCSPKLREIGGIREVSSIPSVYRGLTDAVLAARKRH